jgi:mannose-6-phosphate isomerase-like protein (cupin superfamily)
MRRYYVRPHYRPSRRSPDPDRHRFGVRGTIAARNPGDAESVLIAVDPQQAGLRPPDRFWSSAPQRVRVYHAEESFEIRPRLSGRHQKPPRRSRCHVIAPADAEGDARNRHRGADQWLYVVGGAGTARIEGRRYKLKQGTLLLIESGEKHEIRNDGESPLRTLNFHAPPAYTAGGNPLPRGKR